MIEMEYITEVPIHTLEIGDRFVTRLTGAYGAIIGFIGPTKVQEASVEVALTYPDGRFSQRAIHPNVIVDLER